MSKKTLTDTELTDLENLATFLDVELRHNYSGREMYGKTCIGFITNDVAELCIELGRNESEIGIRFDQPRVDSMGTSAIVYFPRLTINKECEI